MASIIQFKRGRAASWTSQNLLLLAGEPGYEIDTGRLKIGNGTDKWNDLPYVDDVREEVISAATKNDFPAIGDIKLLYKAEDEKKLYQWNPITWEYEPMVDTIEGGVGGGDSGDVDFDEIDMICGGNAEGISS